MKSSEELKEKYKSRNLKEELSWAANYTRKGYMSAEYEDYYSWLALAAYERIKELEFELDGLMKIAETGCLQVYGRDLSGRIYYGW